jgi:hypothetical protein
MKRLGPAVVLHMMITVKAVSGGFTTCGAVEKDGSFGKSGKSD